jgi:hypothetical protein
MGGFRCAFSACYRVETGDNRRRRLEYDEAETAIGTMRSRRHRGNCGSGAGHIQ